MPGFYRKRYPPAPPHAGAGDIASGIVKRMSARWSRLSPRLKDALALLALTVVWGFFFWRLLTSNAADQLQFRQGDLTDQFLAMRQRAYAQIADGRFPVYEPCLYSGYPAQADPQTQLAYPPQLGMFALGRALGWPAYPLRALEWEILAHAWWAAVGMYALLRTLNLRRRASLFGALVFGFGGFMTGYVLLQIALQFTAAWAPWTLWALRRLVRSRRLSPGPVALAAGAAAMSFLGGNPQLFMYAAYVSIFAFMAWSREAGLSWRGLAVRGALTGLMTLGLMAPALIPEALFAASSTRAAASYDFLSGGFPLNDIVSMIVPKATAVWWPLHVGGLALVAIATALRWRWRDARLWILIAAGALLLSFGDHAVGFEMAYLAIPGYAQFRQQERHAFVIALALSIVAAQGVDVLLADLPFRARAWLKGASRTIAVLALLTAALSVAAAVLLRLVPANPSATPMLDSLAALTVVLLAAAGLWRWRATSPAAPVGFAIVALFALVFELGTANRNNPEAIQKPGPAFEAIPVLQPALVAGAPYDPRQVRINNHYGLPLNGACVNGMSEIAGGSPIVDRAYAEFLKRVPEDVAVELLNVRYAVTWRGGMTTEQGVQIPARALATGKYQGNDARLFALDWEPRRDARAWVAPRVSALPGVDALYARLAQQGFDPFGEALVTEPVAGAGPARGAAAVEGVATGYYKVRASSDAPTLLVVSEALLRNWKATVNGAPAAIVRVDGALIGVPIPAGESVLELSYRPDDLFAGLALCLATVVAMCGWRLVLARRRARESI